MANSTGTWNLSEVGEFVLDMMQYTEH